MIVLDLNEQDRQHLRHALGAYVALLRIKGESWPGVAALDAAVRAGQSSGQTRPSPTSADQHRHDADGSQHECLLAPDAAAEVLRISARTLRRRVVAGELPVVKLGPRTTRYRRSDLDLYIERQTE